VPNATQERWLGAERRHANRRQDDLTSEQVAFLRGFAGDYLAGRKVLCWASRAVVGVGILGGALAGIVAGVNALLSLRAR
jgi:hypothetical protein